MSGVNREFLPPFRKLSKEEALSINWEALQQEYVEFIKNSTLVEDGGFLATSLDSNPFFEATMRRVA